MKSEAQRCGWAKSDVSIAYHDAEWGVPVRDERQLFEMLTLEGAQAGLSWDTILKKREGYREAFENFVPERVARFTVRDVNRLMKNEGIVRHRLKLESTVSNAKALIELRKETPFSNFLWSFVTDDLLGNRARPRALQKVTPLPTNTPESDRMSKELKNRGFRFVGTTICYAFMQGVGMVNDHEPSCFRRNVNAQRVAAHGNVPATRTARHSRQNADSPKS